MRQCCQFPHERASGERCGKESEEKRPETLQMESNKTDVISIGVAVVKSGHQVVVGVREQGTHLAGQHEFPGGKCHPGESPAACAIRECGEETGLIVETIELLSHHRHDYSDRSVDLSFFLCRPSDRGDELKLKQPFRWIDMAELADLNFPAGNRTVIQILGERFGSRTEFLA